MNLANFENYIEEKILERGIDYYEDGLVEAITKQEEGKYVASVSGKENYQIEVVVSKQGEIIETSCDCPYDFGDYCKHQVAVFLELRDGNHFKKKAEKKKMLSLEDILVAREKDELIKIILELSDKYNEIEHKIKVRYTASNDEVSTSKKLIRDYINKAKVRGFIDWRNSGRAVQGAVMVLDKAREHIDTNPERAVELSLIVLPTGVDMLQYCDDSSGYVGDIIRESLYLIDTAVSIGKQQLSTSRQKTLFDKLVKEARHKRYDGWEDWRFDLLRVCIYFCDNNKFRELIEKQIESMIPNQLDGWSTTYKTAQLKLLQFEMIKQFDDEQKKYSFIYENIQHNEFRKIAIVDALKLGNYEKVIELCLTGEEADKEYRGLVDKWKKYRYEAYEQLGDTQAQKDLALYLLYKNEYDYYLKLKSLYGPEEWPAVVQEILTTFEIKEYQLDIYKRILIAENKTELLLKYCERNPFYITTLYPHLLNEYENQVSNLFVTYLEKRAAETSDRRGYKNVCKEIKVYKKACGSERATNLIESFKHKYVRRTAFLDELSKIK